MPKIVENAILIYTDGSLYPKGRKGGYGFVFVHVDRIGVETVLDTHAPPGITGTTNNRMELQACISALKLVGDLDCYPTVSQLVIRTDSRYVVNNFAYARGSWRSNGWRNKAGRPIENADLWKELVKAREKLHKRADFEWVKGHGKGKAKDFHNVLADRLAKESASSPLSRPVYRSSVRRKKGSSQTVRGSVEMRGQQIAIYIIEAQPMRLHKLWKYRYEVVSKDSSDKGNIDWIFSKIQMRDGHCYEVQMNENTDNPEVLAMLREVPKDAV